MAPSRDGESAVMEKMLAARTSGPAERVAVYRIPDDALSAGSTLGGPRITAVIKATGAVEKVFCVDSGDVVFGSLVLHHWDETTGIHLSPEVGEFIIHPERQEHRFRLSNNVEVHEVIFCLSGEPDGDDVDPPALYYTVSLRNDSHLEANVATYGFCELRGHTGHDVRARFDERADAIVAWNESTPSLARVFGCTPAPTSYTVTGDHAIATEERWPGRLDGSMDGTLTEPLGVLQLSHRIAPGEQVRFTFLLSFSPHGDRHALQTYRACPDADAALTRTSAYYAKVLGRSVVMTPDLRVNRGVLWAKANMLRVQNRAPTGWAFTNDPTRSNNSVARDTAWFAFGADYLTPWFSRASLMAYVERQEPKGMIVEYYDLRNGKTCDYDLNVNDNTPLLVLALWHHYNATCDREFLERIYPCARKAMDYMLSQRNDDGLVWCTATGTADWGIVGWRNVIPNMRISGATTELNSECYAALRTVSQMARLLGDHEQSAAYAQAADALRAAIERHLRNPRNHLYYLNIDVDGTRRSNVTSDLVFPVIFGVADDETAAQIVTRLSEHDFWTDAGIRTVPRDAPDYGPTHGYGLRGGVWVGVTFWYAFAGARFIPEFTADALGISFDHYSRDPGKNNTVPGQFSEWLNGETLVNQGMMLSPWFPPRYLWAAIEGAGGLNLEGSTARITPRLAADWKWLAVRNVPYRGRTLTWIAVRVPDLRLYTDFEFDESTEYTAYADDISADVHVLGSHAVYVALRKENDLLLFVGNTSDRTISVALAVDARLDGGYRVNEYNSLRNGWRDGGLVDAREISQGLSAHLERKGFAVFDLRQER